MAVSSGLLRRSRSERPRGLAHEIGHVANGDMITLSGAGRGQYLRDVLCPHHWHTVDRVVFKTERGYGIGYYVVTIVAEIVLGILASMIVMWFSVTGSTAPTRRERDSLTAKV